MKVTVTVLPLAVALDTVETLAAYGSAELVLARLMEYATSAPVNGVPSLQVTPERTVTV